MPGGAGARRPAPVALGCRARRAVDLTALPDHPRPPFSPDRHRLLGAVGGGPGIHRLAGLWLEHRRQPEAPEPHQDGQPRLSLGSGRGVCCAGGSRLAGRESRHPTRHLWRSDHLRSGGVGPEPEEPPGAWPGGRPGEGGCPAFPLGGGPGGPLARAGPCCPCWPPPIIP